MLRLISKLLCWLEFHKPPYIQHSDGTRTDRYHGEGVCPRCGKQLVYFGEWMTVESRDKLTESAMKIVEDDTNFFVDIDEDVAERTRKESRKCSKQ